MAMPLLVLAGIMSILTAPGLIAQHLEAKKARKAGLTTEGEVNV